MAAEKVARRNDEISAPRVRVINDAGEQIGILYRREAIQLARESGLDLVEVSPNAEPPVCRIMDYGKFAFEKNKSQQAARRKQKLTQIKEIKFRPGTDDGDYQVKLRNLIRFLNDGDKAKVTLRFRGREMQHQDLGRELLDRLRTDLAEYAVVEQDARLEGRLMVMMLAPKKK
ncbi:MAG TPA: translation initiation factor IF-3 [Candidatus Acidoferrales bacterium]|nr:translation initiation factor IF-3 [Candidatus Acidoferrales bacterium]